MRGQAQAWSASWSDFKYINHFFKKILIPFTDTGKVFLSACKTISTLSPTCKIAKCFLKLCVRQNYVFFCILLLKNCIFVSGHSSYSLSSFKDRDIFEPLLQP